MKIITLRTLLETDYKFEAEPIVEGLLSRGEFVILSAKAKTGKSMLAMNLALSVARGQSFLNKYLSRQGKVLLIQTEITSHFLQERFKSMTSHQDQGESLDNVFISEGFSSLENQYSELESVLNEIKPDLLVLDPFYTLHSKDENKASEMAPILCLIQKVTRDFGCACLLVHHQGKHGEMNSKSQAGHSHRGSSSFADVPDASWSLEKSSNTNYFLSTEFRNRQSLDRIPLTFSNETLHFEAFADNSIHGKPEACSETKLKEIIQLCSEIDGLPYPQIIKDAERILGLKESSVGKILKKGIESGVFIKTVNGRNSFYKINPITVTH